MKRREIVMIIAVIMGIIGCIIGMITDFNVWQVACLTWVIGAGLDCIKPKRIKSYLEFHMNNGDILTIDTWWDEFEEISNNHSDNEFISFKDISGGKVLVKLSSISHIIEK